MVCSMCMPVRLRLSVIAGVTMNQQHDGSRLERIDLNLFRVFEVIYRERNLTRATRSAANPPAPLGYQAQVA